MATWVDQLTVGVMRSDSLGSAHEHRSPMQLDITDDAVSWVVQRGGTAAVDFIKPIG